MVEHEWNLGILDFTECACSEVISNFCPTVGARVFTN